MHTYGLLHACCTDISVVSGMLLTGQITTFSKGPKFYIQEVQRQNQTRQAQLEEQQIANSAREVEIATEFKAKAQADAKAKSNRGSQSNRSRSGGSTRPSARSRMKPTPGQNAAQRQKAQQHVKRVAQILSRCPSKYQSTPHLEQVQILVRLLSESPDGLYQPDIVQATNIPRTNCIEYLSMLLRIGDATRDNKKGFLYKLHPKHYD
eukprot:CFRG4437T1